MAVLAQTKTVQGFKAGPDYIDPGYHTAATGRISSNLDTWMVGPEEVVSLFGRASIGADISLIEGVMGLFDGFDALSENGSTAQLAKILDAPVILVIDAGSMARSAGAVAMGFRDFDPKVNVAGVIANNLSGKIHAQWIKEAVEDIGLPVVGCIPRTDLLSIPERHLGLRTAGEKNTETRLFINAARDIVAENVDIERLLKIARSAPEIWPPTKKERPNTVRPVTRIAIARDEAFCFYYEDNFDLLRDAGAELIFFSPLRDHRLPDDINGMYIGGGYPELYAAQLAENSSLRADMRNRILSGMPTYAECGGLMLLAEQYIGSQSESYSMVGVLPGSTRLTGSLTMGYREVTAIKPGILLNTGDIARGHEFHYSNWAYSDELANFAYNLISKEGRHQPEGFLTENLLASYVHLHFASNPAIAPRFVDRCQNWKRSSLKK
jgi:cobyrinic acid a,c-diamide synthase